MEKKPKYTQSSAKGTSPGDSKKNQDVVNGGRLFPKTLRRRESSGTTSSYNKNEQQSKKANAQKARSFDKRPKPKGLYHGGAKENTKVEEEEAAELGSVMVPGSKKQNLNHLLNFHYAPRDVGTNSGGWMHARGDPMENKRRLPPIHRHKYNKEQFLQANCQFVVKDNADYRAHLADPDTLVDWNLIEQIRMHSSGRLSCPICLYPPVAGKMTRCGHVYCWPCILHYLALSDKAWRKCPICYESVHKTDLKSFVEVSQNHMGVGDEVKLRLMRRERGSLIAVPVGETEIETALPSNFASVAEANSREIYSKLLLASVSDVMDIIESERVQLRLELTEDPNSPENCFIEQALTDLLTREEQICCVVNSAKLDEESSIANEPSVEKPPETVYDTAGDSESSDTAKDETSESLGPRALSKFFYFYQAIDGQHLYLHAMNIKMLELQYGSLENCPRTIWGKILEKEVGSFSEELRRRMRYLHHLPLTCTFEIAEIELGPPLITDEVRGYFAEQVGNREKRRRRRERDERKREKKITTEENKQMGKFASPKVHIESHKHFPQWQPEFQSAGINVPSPAESVATSSVASSPRGSYFEDKNTVTLNHFDFSRANPSDQQPQASGPSFAQMLQNKGLRSGSNNVVAWPSINPSIEPPTNRSNALLQDDEDAYAAAAPSYNQSFCHDLAQSLSVADFFQTGKNRDDVNSSGKKKKKKCKTTVLFATSMSRAS